MINWIQNWYKDQCDNNWEHDYGIKIETLDNPGWGISIDLIETRSKIDSIPWTVIEISESNWVGFKIENNIFNGSGDPNKLNLIIYIFKQLYSEGEILESEIIIKMKNNF